MYFPYLRGKQFELIALREICSFIKNKEIISPIIEPVKEATVTLLKTIECLVKHELNFNLIINPKIGDIKNPQIILNIIKSHLTGYTNYQPSFVVNQNSNFGKLSEVIEENNLDNITIICNEIPKEEEEFLRFITKKEIKFVVINEDIASKRFVRTVVKSGVKIVTLSDSFNGLKRNADYLENENEFFSDEHLFYKTDGYVGYSDYTTMSKEYSDTGFLPYAIAIHLTYLNENDEFWIRHFVSDSNEDTTDVAGKFSEALEKLVVFINAKNIHTLAADEFRSLHSSGTYSGLGSIKKLSVKHHIELVYEFLNSPVK